MSTPSSVNTHWLPNGYQVLLQALTPTSPYFLLAKVCLSYKKKKTNPGAFWIPRGNRVQPAQCFPDLPRLPLLLPLLLHLLQLLPLSPGFISHSFSYLLNRVLKTLNGKHQKQIIEMFQTADSLMSAGCIGYLPISYLVSLLVIKQLTISIAQASNPLPRSKSWPWECYCDILLSLLALTVNMTQPRVTWLKN